MPIIELKCVQHGKRKPKKGIPYLQIRDENDAVLIEQFPQGNPVYFCAECETRISPELNVYCQTCGTEIDWSGIK